MKMKSTTDKRIYGVYNGAAYVLDGTAREYSEAVKNAYAHVLEADSETPKSEPEPDPEPDDNEYDGGY